MSGLAVRNKSGELLQYTGTQFEGLENTGTHHLCVRTGPGVGGVRKYGLTSAPLNDKYKGLRMRMRRSMPVKVWLVGAGPGGGTRISRRGIPLAPLRLLPGRIQRPG